MQVSRSRTSIRLLSLGLAATLFAPLAVAGDLNLDITSAGQRVVTVAPGAAVPWQVRGELSTSSTQGLAMVSFDMHFTGGALTAATNPVSMPMQNFAMPLGFTNPAGFGGTVVGNDLVQVGGAQNTILNVFAPYPTGSVITGVAQLGAPQVLATGTLTAPAVVGTYTLSLDNFMANAIQGSATGSPNWAVEPVGVGSVSSMTVVVSALKVNNNTISVATLGSRIYTLEAGAANAGRLYFMLGTFTGTSPGLNFANGLHLPLNPSFYLNWTASNPNTAPLSNSLGFLNGSGMATTTFTLPHVPASAAGLVLHHAYVLLSPLDFASNPVAITLVP